MALRRDIATIPLELRFSAGPEEEFKSVPVKTAVIFTGGEARQARQRGFLSDGAAAGGLPDMGWAAPDAAEPQRVAPNLVAGTLGRVASLDEVSREVRALAGDDAVAA